MRKKMKILITNYSVLFNRGSEAVIRSIVLVCRYWKPDSFITVSTGEEGEISKDISDADCIIPRYDAEGEISYLLAAAREADVVLVTGADNYDSPQGNQKLTDINTRLLCETRGKTILYDCSLNENNFIDKTYADFSRFSYITARESETYNLFMKKFEKDRVGIYPDPAFIMPTKECDLPAGFEQGKMIGINVSNLILSGKYGASEEKILLSYSNLIDFILARTEYKIILVQHIVNNGFDLEALNKVYKLYEKEKRVILMKTEVLDAMQIKYLISKLQFLVTARTHASIAAYSTCVPTLVVSYSIKSVGIARDLFGEADSYVLSLHEIKDGTELQRKFEYMLKHEGEICEYLQKKIPLYKMQALKFGEVL